MSHSVVITRTTTTTTSTSHVVLNTGYLRTTPGLLKLAQLIIGAVNVGLVSWHFRSYYAANPQVFFLLMAVAFLIGTFCLLASCLVSLSTGGIISKTIYELFYHTVAFILYLIASIILLVHVTDYSYRANYKNSHIAAAIIGSINTGIFCYYFRGRGESDSHIFFLLMVATFLVGTFCQLVSCLISKSTEEIISKSFFELIYNVVAFTLYLISSIVMFAWIQRHIYNSIYKYNLWMTCIIGAVNVGIVSWYLRRFHSIYASGNPELFFLLMAVAFLIGTFCLLVSCLVSLSTGGIISKTIYELVYHTIAFLLYLIASIILLVDVTNGRYHSDLKDSYMAASILGIIVSALYLFSALIAQRSYRGI